MNFLINKNSWFYFKTCKSIWVFEHWCHYLVVFYPSDVQVLESWSPMSWRWSGGTSQRGRQLGQNRDTLKGVNAGFMEWVGASESRGLEDYPCTCCFLCVTVFLSTSLPSWDTIRRFSSVLGFWVTQTVRQINLFSLHIKQCQVFCYSNTKHDLWRSSGTEAPF